MGANINVLSRIRREMGWIIIVGVGGIKWLLQVCVEVLFVDAEVGYEVFCGSNISC